MKRRMQVHFALKELIQVGMDEDGVHRSATGNRRKEGDIAESRWKRSEGLSLDWTTRRYLVGCVGWKGFASCLGLRSRRECEPTLYSPFGGKLTENAMDERDSSHPPGVVLGGAGVYE